MSTRAPGSPDVPEQLQCGCVTDSETGLLLRACDEHDIRTPRVQFATALQQIGAHLDDAATHFEDSYMELGKEGFPASLREAARVAVKAGRQIMRGKEE